MSSMVTYGSVALSVHLFINTYTDSREEKGRRRLFNKFQMQVLRHLHLLKTLLHALLACRRLMLKNINIYFNMKKMHCNRDKHAYLSSNSSEEKNIFGIKNNDLPAVKIILCT